MPELVMCPACSRKLRVPDELLGKMVKCPECKGAFRAETGPNGEQEDAQIEKAAPKSSDQRVSTRTRSSDAESERAPVRRRDEEEEDEDYPRRPADDFNEDEGDDDRVRKRSRGSVRAGWQRVRLGLHLYIIGIYIFIGALILFLLSLAVGLVLGFSAVTSVLAALGSGNTAGPSKGGSGAFVGAVVILIIGYVVFIIGALMQWIMQVIGQVFFLWIPDKPGTGRRSLAISTLSLTGAQLVLLLSSYGMLCLGATVRSGNASGAIGLGSNCASLISYVCALAWFFVFMFLLRAIAQGTGNERLARTCVIFMITVPVYTLLAVMTLVAAACLGGAATVGLASKSSTAGGAASIGTGFLVLLAGVYMVILLIGLGLWIWYVVILHKARTSIDARLNR